MSSLFYIPNHSAAELKQISPADLAAKTPVHDQFPNKPAFAKWEHSIKTEHYFYTAIEPLQPGLRVSKDNPPVRCHALIADYDGMVDDRMHASAIANLPGIPPTWVTRTFSGKARWIWEFENPIPVYTTDLFAKFMTALAKQLKVADCLPGLDPVYTSPYSVYELGRDWKQPAGNVKVPTAIAYAILSDVSKKAKFSGPEIPMSAVEAECRRRWGDRVPETFEKGTRCTRFWDKNADNVTGALIHESGVQAFTGEGRFLDWSDLLGSDFTRGFVQERVGGAIEGIYYDSKKFWVRDADECWSPLPTEHLRNMLHVKHGLSPASKKGEPSQVNVAMNSIVELQKISGVFPFLYSPGEVVQEGKSKILNISEVSLATAQQPPAKWGEDFPWISEYLDQLFDKEQLRIFLSWLAHFYQSARNGDLRNGQGLFVAGPPGSGKTFLSNVLIAKLMGGKQEVSSFILGTTQFITAHEKPVWTVDDAVASSDNKSHTLYSQLVKKVIANFSLPYHPKGVDAVDQEWLGRLIVTLNDDPESIQMLPSVEHSILDKVIFLKAGATTVDFTDSTKTVAKELPAFAAFLRDWKTPEELTGDWRFGVKSWQHPDLLQHAKQASPTAGLSELLDLWRAVWFRQDEVDEWTGTATELLRDLNETDSIKSLVRSTATNRGMLGRGLSKLVTEGTPWISSKRTSSNRLYTIKPD